jgi:pimeloyl-ACP methyl ester carboxylesterase
MIYPWMFEDYAELRKVQDVAERVAADADWPALFDEAQLAKNEVPVFAAAYTEDMYVDYDLSMETARAIRGCKVFTTNVMFHDAIRSRMDEVVRQAFNLRDDVVD